ncbi:hypothetical protein F3J38_21685 [Pantoea sp. Acro-805]|uniref:SinR family protein n=1 Tax=Candidatus Pantoea formicae TaxID=2608355 RepID=A0ABX0R072_9GAMM|nr:hypothetical protein [Pantoea formicae]
MTVFCISYDHNTPGQKYDALYQELKKTDHLHPLDSTWLTSTNENAENLCIRLRKHLDSNDHLLIIKVTRPYNGWLTQSSWDWIASHLT